MGLDPQLMVKSILLIDGRKISLYRAVEKLEGGATDFMCPHCIIDQCRIKGGGGKRGQLPRAAK